MEISSLKVVLLVQRQGSLAGAARILNMDPSSVSRTVAAVEAELGIRLFQRTTRRLAITEEGKLYLQRLAPLIEELEAAQEEALGTRRRPAGVLTMTASVAFSSEIIVPLLPAFQDAYPDVTVDLQCSDANLDLIENGIDLAIRLAPAPTGDLISTRLMPTRYRAVASPDYLRGKAVDNDPRVLQNLNCLRFSLPNFQNRWRFKRDGHAAIDVEVSGSLLISNALALRQAARAGMGVALLADWLVHDDLAQGRLIDLFPNYKCAITDFDTAAWGLYPSRSFLPGKVRAMLDYLRANLPQATR